MRGGPLALRRGLRLKIITRILSQRCPQIPIIDSVMMRIIIVIFIMDNRADVPCNLSPALVEYMERELRYARLERNRLVILLNHNEAMMRDMDKSLTH
jgi:hypothetical protein